MSNLAVPKRLNQAAVLPEQKAGKVKTKHAVVQVGIAMGTGTNVTRSISTVSVLDNALRLGPTST
ncbi:hypothetical protein [Halomonas sp.]|uniref:hypothetical protein n=1 Tax=Halomonas sp. TaxID=1486246 RepID=UPI00298E62B7|nr:hypothetical protein [Halomonas sp.]MDW7745837.1 hypothetical protein [Halomonas sp.]